MTDTQGNARSSPTEALGRYVPLAIWVMVAAVILAIPLKIIGYGYLPFDDALRHAAKAVSGKPWPEILVTGPAFQIDHNFGWHFILRQFFLWSHCDTEGLVMLSVVALFVLAGWSALPWLKRPEAWLVALGAGALGGDMAERLALGRPFLLTIAGLLTILFSWQIHGSSRPSFWQAVWVTLVIAACSFVHGVWYLWSLPVAAFFLARQFRWGIMVAFGWLAGVVLGAAFTGHPYESLYQALEIARRAFSMHATQRTLASEIQPSDGEPMGLIILGGLLILRQLAKLNAPPMSRNPAFWLACICWILSFKARRFSTDWGWPALLVLIASDVQMLLQTRFAAESLRRLALAGGIAAATFLIFTNDAGSRWTKSLTWTFLTPDNPDLAGWMPEPGGIIYSADMSIFYQTFFKNPNGNWRYVLGYEPAFMTDEDFKVYHSVLWNSGDIKAYAPWLEKMTPADRFVIRGEHSSNPNMPQLEWNYGVSGIWVGRLPAHRQDGAPATIRATETRVVPGNSGSSTR